MAVGPLDVETVTLVPDQLNMTQKVDMTIFRLTHWNLDFKSSGNGLRMEFTMKRKVVSELLTTYFPSLLLIAITFATTTFKPVFFEAALSVNLTTMLVLTTIFISKMESLPPTSDIKMIDIWLVLCQMVPFAEVVLLTAMEYHREEENGQISEMIFQKPSSNLEDEDTYTETITKKVKGLVSLKTIGKFLLSERVQNQYFFFFSEKKVLPFMVLSCFSLYFGIAAVFYTQS